MSTINSVAHFMVPPAMVPFLASWPGPRLVPLSCPLQNDSKFATFW